MKALIYFGGFFNVFFALFHSGFWKACGWDTELSKLTPLNSGVMQIMNIQLIFYFVFTAVVCFAFPNALRSTKLGKCFLVGTSMFWLIRTVQQFIFLDVDNILMPILTILFVFGTVLFLIPVFYKEKGIK